MRPPTLLFTLVAGALFWQAAATAEPAVPALPGAPQAPVVLAPPPGATPPAAAQRFRGTLQEFDGPFLTLKTADKKIVTLGMTTATRIVHNRSLQLTDLPVGAFVSVAALRTSDNKLRAQGIRLYPASMRGAGEGLYPLDPANPARLLLNGSVTAVTPGGIGGIVAVGFHGAVGAAPDCAGRAAPGGCSGVAQVIFARGVPIVAIDGGDPSQLLPGATVSVSAAPDAGGTLVATTVTVERDAPPPKL
ncbi:MAG TPA: DUF5666 domain-containing protein [Rhizomicrobium sp.]|jgi:hypothetical protein|nr:DUF5666 domain-containing protein [Rhizomicrobium sp.]